MASTAIPQRVVSKKSEAGTTERVVDPEAAKHGSFAFVLMMPIVLAVMVLITIWLTGSLR